MQNAVLFDLPTFPRGVLALSLPTVAACLRPFLNVRIVDLNFYEERRYEGLLVGLGSVHLAGLKVSAQNLELARAFTRLLRRLRPEAKVVLGGELPTLLPAACLEHADSVVQGRFEPHARAFVEGLREGRLLRVYEDAGPAPLDGLPPPALDLVEGRDGYLGFMGTPLESSLGCPEKCTFCMVHSTQPLAAYRSGPSLAADLRANPREFVNVLDYNLGASKAHLLALAAELGRSRARGWMGELCLSALEDDETLDALAESRCRIVYCGLESLSDKSLRTVVKPQNKTGEYLRLVRRAQGRGIEVGSGFILGLDGNEASFPEFLDFCEEAGILYIKLTFLTFNPGTKVQASMRAKGRYLTEEIPSYDGCHLTFLPGEGSAQAVFEGARAMIARFYSWPSLWRRSRHLAGSPLRRAEFILFSHCYGQVYRQWLAYDILRVGGGRFEDLLRAPMVKGLRLRLAEGLLAALRRGFYRPS